MHPLANFIAFQAGWFASVLGAAHGAPWLGPVVVSVVVLLHLAAVTRPRQEGWLLLAALGMGALVDSLFVAFGFLQYANGQWATWLAPYWIIAMWPLFATTLNVSLRWLRGRPALAACLGAVAGPASYYAGEGLGAVQAAPGLAPWLVIGAAWALMMPVLMRLAGRLDGVVTGPLPACLSGWMGNA